MLRPLPWLIMLLLAVFGGCSSDKTESVARTDTTASADSTRISYAVDGQGPHVVLIHCWGCNQTFFSETVEVLNKQFTVVTMDLSGHGQSEARRMDYDIGGFAEDVLAVMDAAGVQEAVLVGHSMGGLVAMEVAHLDPDRVKGIVGIDNLHRIEHGFNEQDIMRITMPMKVKFRRTVIDHTKRMFPAGTDTAKINRALNAMTAMDSEVAISAFENLFTYDLVTAADALQVPLHIIHDSAGQVNTQEWAAHGVEVRTTALRSVGHYPMFTQPQEFNRKLMLAIKDF